MDSCRSQVGLAPTCNQPIHFFLGIWAWGGQQTKTLAHRSQCQFGMGPDNTSGWLIDPHRAVGCESSPQSCYTCGKMAGLTVLTAPAS